MKKWIAILPILIPHFLLNAQNGYWIVFKDKCTAAFDALEYFDSKAIERRIIHGLPLYDNRDLPVCEAYVEQLSQLVDSVGYASRWINALAVYASDAKIEAINEFDFVKSISKMALYDASLAQTKSQENATEELLSQQLERMGGKHFEEKQWTGKGVRIAIFDAGFPGVDEMKEFEHVRNAKRIIATYDFVKKRASVYNYNQHGTNVMSCISGVSKGRKIGMATDAEFLLARTENAFREPFSEEQNWLAAVEWADKNGAQVINSSLAYTYHHYFKSEMDGSTSFVAKAANIAASKGILVVNAAGNDGDNNWKVIGTPGDADSVLTIGGIDPETGFHIGFSSFGPNKSNQLKPNLAAYGEAIVAGKSGITVSRGTSFSSPLVAGFAACVMESNPTMTNMALFEELQKSGHLYPYFDYAHGYGIPQANYFTEKQNTPSIPTFTFEKGNTMLSVKVSPETKPDELIYYHIETAKGYLKKYFVIRVDQEYPIRINLNIFNPGEKLRVHCNGYTAIYNF